MRFIKIGQGLLILFHDQGHQTELNGICGGEVLVLDMGGGGHQQHLLPEGLHHQRSGVVGSV